MVFINVLLRNVGRREKSQVGIESGKLVRKGVMEGGRWWWGKKRGRKGKNKSVGQRVCEGRMGMEGKSGVVS
ncbi:unnamed protein product [Sphenostylis stenocarpa]|uniref:Uncharacterized protein n=1 Tax=Sphenostylis stenocarpa TaxID=92480 RepID=A0AA87B6I4_9FABA|nr:unnamed protein product [Sphenostylis stenocarpa]